MPETPRDWGRIMVGTRLEKNVSAKFFAVWMELITKGLRAGDMANAVRGHVAHRALNRLVRLFLESPCDTLMTLDSDADIPPDFVERFRTYEPGFVYDALQAFYVRRGWPPRAIWMRRDVLGQMMEWYVFDPDTVEDVDVVGTHCALFRRELFEAMLGDANPDRFDWFYYPRHDPASEDAALSAEAKLLGFRLGATTALKAGHLAEITVGWEAYQQYLGITGHADLITRYSDLAQLIASFTGEEPDLVVAKAKRAGANTARPWARLAPSSAADVRAFYGRPDNGYLYELLNWNCQPLYERLIAPLYEVHGERVLVVGAGLGTEVEVLLGRGNTVEVFELPGVLRTFLQHRFGGRDDVVFLDGATVAEALTPAPARAFDRAVMIDVIEHIHPDEFDATMDAVAALVDTFTLHVNFDRDRFPQHYDHSRAFAAWCARWGIVQTGESTWVKQRDEVM